MQLFKQDGVRLVLQKTSKKTIGYRGAVRACFFGTIKCTPLFPSTSVQPGCCFEGLFHQIRREVHLLRADEPHAEFFENARAVYGLEEPESRNVAKPLPELAVEM